MNRSRYLATLLMASAAATALAAGGSVAQDHDPESAETHYRLFIGDHAEGVVRAIDLEDSADAGTFRIDLTPALTRSTSGRTIFAVQGEAGAVAVIATGIDVEDHGDHRDLHVTDARLLETAITGTRPAHVIEGSGTIALFDDGTGSVSLFAENAVLEGAFDPVVLEPGAAHHGLAAPMGDYIVVSVPHESPDAPRVGLRVIDRQGAPVGAVVPCPGVHGQAQSARVFAFGCRDGVVIATPSAGSEPPVLEHISTAGLGEGNVSTLKGGTALQFFLGNFGPAAVVLIEPGSDAPFRRIDLPTRRVDFALDPINPRNAYVLTEDGQLHLLDVIAGAITQSLQLTDPYSMDGHWRDARPRLAVAGDHIAVTDPRAGLVRLLSIDRFAQERTIPVDGTPYTIVAVGGSGADH
ncbi:hypothetical protein [Pararhodobacter zhoushanensis]|uniref:Uncharacterized protein n=1 Tax=Pararhodobacter zhoushanensis TaxID=2479545 RepID=A0ABT3GTC6_9RHOB|nr:hypothetical protein [Pararhodobacter zhoushanensis]MCW1930786.1 hypothetical protein [Pararhodobacter zhoushanensis]